VGEIVLYHLAHNFSNTKTERIKAVWLVACQETSAPGAGNPMPGVGELPGPGRFAWVQTKLATQYQRVALDEKLLT
jgi:hypothetical protein